MNDQTERDVAPRGSNSAPDDAKTGIPTKCTCEVCELGIPTPMNEWLAMSPLHQEIHERIKAALINGEIQVKGKLT